jgi:hypothetical protein
MAFIPAKHNGKRILINSLVLFAFVEGEGGSASAVSIAGVSIPLSSTFDEIEEASELADEMDDDETEGDPES